MVRLHIPTVICALSMPCGVYAAAGDMDVTFSGDGMVSTLGHHIALQPDGKIIAVGLIYNANTGDDDAYVARYFSDGTPDTSFGVNGVVMTDVPALGAGLRDNYATTVAVQPNGKIVVGGEVYTGAARGYDWTLTRYEANGALDTTFAGTGYVVLDFGGEENDLLNDIALLPAAAGADSKIAVTGTTYNPAISNGYVFAVARYNANGTLDTSFSSDGLQTTQMRSGTSGSSNARAIALQADGKLVVAGNAWRGTTTKDDVAVARYLSNGNLDTTFDGDGKAYVNFSNYDYGTGLAIQGDGKLVIAGQVNTDGVGGASDFGVMRLTTAGKLDTSFDGDGKLTTPFVTYEFANAITVQGDGKLVVVGGARSASDAGQYPPVMARYNVNGSLDTTFSGDGKVQNDSITSAHRDVLIDGNGKILTSGSGYLIRYLSQ